MTTSEPARPSSASAHEALAIWFDGASRGNGRAGARAAIGAVVRDARTGERLAVVACTIGEETNNVAEYRALLAALDAARQFGARRLRIHGDSALVIQQLRGAWKVKAAHLAPLIHEARLALANYDEVQLEQVPRAANAEADALANAALDAELGDP
jgi:probable phosphoglycerate mutase